MFIDCSSCSRTYASLTGQPTIPAAQVQSNWTETTTTAPDYITNKPTLAPVATAGTYASFTGTPALAPVATSRTYASLTGQPTQLSRFTNNITNFAPLSTPGTLSAMGQSTLGPTSMTSSSVTGNEAVTGNLSVAGTSILAATTISTHPHRHCHRNSRQWCLQWRNHYH